MAFAAVMIGTFSFIGSLPMGLLLFDMPFVTALFAAFLTSQGTLLLVIMKALICRSMRRSQALGEQASTWAPAPQLTKR